MTVFNTAPGGKTIRNSNLREWAVKGDIVSAVDRMKLFLTNGDSNVIRSKASGGFKYEPLTNHEISQFTNLKDLTGESPKYVEINHEVIKDHALRNKSFSKYIETVSEGKANLNDLMKTRAHDELIKSWRASGAEFTPRESEIINNRAKAPSSEPRFTPEHHPSVDTPRARYHVNETATNLGASLVLGVGASQVFDQLGISDPYANTALSGAVGGAGGRVISNTGVRLTGRVSSRVAASSLTSTASRTIASGALRAGIEGGALGLVALPVDQLLNRVYRNNGMDEVSANALSGFTSTVAVGGGAAAVSTTLASVAAGELTLGPMGWGAAGLTFAAAGISAGIGAWFGASERRERQRHEREIQQALEQAHSDATRVAHLEHDLMQAALNNTSPPNLTNEDTALISQHDSDFSNRLQAAVLHQNDQQAAQNMGIQMDNYYSMLTSIHNGTDSHDAVRQALVQQSNRDSSIARQNGFTSYSDFMEYNHFRDTHQYTPGGDIDQWSKALGAQRSNIRNRELEDANTFNSLQNQALGAGYVSSHSYLADSGKWNPETSLIARAHRQGLTFDQYSTMMQERAGDRYIGTTSRVNTKYTQAQITQQHEDDLHAFHKYAESSGFTQAQADQYLTTVSKG